MAGEEHSGPAGRDLPEQLGHVGDRDRVEAGDRLVEHQEVGLVDQRRDELHALLVAVVPSRVDAVVGSIGKAEALEPGHVHAP